MVVVVVVVVVVVFANVVGSSLCGVAVVADITWLKVTWSVSKCVWSIFSLDNGSHSYLLFQLSYRVGNMLFNLCSHATLDKLLYSRSADADINADD